MSVNFSIDWSYEQSYLINFFNSHGKILYATLHNVYEKAWRDYILWGIIYLDEVLSHNCNMDFWSWDPLDVQNSRSKLVKLEIQFDNVDYFAWFRINMHQNARL